MSNTLVQTAQPVLTGEALLLAQENLLIAALRRPSLSSTMKLTGINERHFPDHLRPAFNIVLTKSQDEIRHLVALADSRIWPLYGKRIIEWNDARVRTAARQLVDSAWSTEDSALFKMDSEDAQPLRLQRRQNLREFLRTGGKSRCFGNAGVLRALGSRTVQGTISGYEVQTQHEATLCGETFSLV